MDTEINVHIVEIRYRPNSKMIDYRGAWADALSNCLLLPKWRVDPVRIDLHDEDNKHHVFVSFQNTGLVIRSAPTRNYFPDHTSRFLKYLFQLTGFESRPHVERLGVRARFCTPFDGSFSELVRLYSTKFLQLSESATKALNAKVVDVGSPLVLEDALGNINYMGGPMNRGQLSQFFQQAELPEVALVSDIDYWVTPSEQMTEAQLAQRIKDFSAACWSMRDRLNGLILR